MDDHLRALIFGLSAALLLPLLCFLLGMGWSKLIGGWQDSKFRRWWTTICLLMPFLFVGMMLHRMGDDNFQGIRSAWLASPVAVALIGISAALVSIALVFQVLRIWGNVRA